MVPYMGNTCPNQGLVCTVQINQKMYVDLPTLSSILWCIIEVKVLYRFVIFHLCSCKRDQCRLNIGDIRPWTVQPKQGGHSSHQLLVVQKSLELWDAALCTGCRGGRGGRGGEIHTVVHWSWLWQT